jgi:hypothetical protein
MKKYQLNDSILLINANDIPISIAGLLKARTSLIHKTLVAY